MKRFFLIGSFFFFITYILNAQEAKEYKIACIAFYNVENLFDTIPGKNDVEFSPAGGKKWNTAKYYAKIDTLGSVINRIGREITNTAPAIVGVSEIENISVLEDLVKADGIKKYNYQIVHFDGPDYRGVDCALLYRPEYFTVTNTAMHNVYTPDDPKFRTRDQLLISGKFEGEDMHFIVLHWPSRSGGEKRSAPKRFAAATVTRNIVDSILNIDPNSKIVIMGDLNDDPDNKSVKKYMNTTSNKDKAQLPYLYNTMEPLFNKGIGSLAYQDKWNLFDQIIITPAFLNNNKSSYRFYQAYVFNKTFLMQKEGRFKGYPLRTYVGNTYVGGYSDHFPTYIYIIKENKK